MDNNLDIITSYLKGELTEAEMQEVASNEALREEMEFARQMQFVQEHKEQIKVQQMLTDIFADMPATADSEPTEQATDGDVPELPPQTGTGKLWMWGVGSVIAVIFICFIAMNPLMFGIYTTTQRLALQETTHLDSHTRYDTSIEKNDFGWGFEAYDKQDYRAAIPHLESYTNIHPKDTDIKLYLGISQLHAKKYEESLLTLQSLTGTTDNRFIPKHINWYMGVALLMNYETEAALNYFSKIPTDNPHYVSARELIKQIKNQ